MEELTIALLIDADNIGEQKTPEAFRVSCEKFISIDIIDEDIELEDAKLEISVFLDKKIDSIRISGNNAELIK
ncbi:hypothetical protein [Clostridium tagluense]|uniref:hypothetical protein n=1 Tax=Clostridium tagluense TaxID=360422 RepID=UPI001CF12520|nr:hypothetical protein [Clostridium tagluense]MCB2300255.1 hypothetical protein [Clostridium tagluense]